MSGRRFKFIRDYGELFNHWARGTVIEPMHIGWATTLVQRGILEELPVERQAVIPMHVPAETAAAAPVVEKRRGRPRKSRP